MILSPTPWEVMSKGLCGAWLPAAMGLNYDSTAKIHHLHSFLDRKWFLTVSNQLENMLQKAPNSMCSFFLLNYLDVESDSV